MGFIHLKTHVRFTAFKARWEENDRKLRVKTSDLIKTLGRQADTLYKHLARLDLLLVMGRLGQRKYEDKTGRTCWDTYLIVENFEFMWQPRGVAIKGYHLVKTDEFERLKVLAEASGHADDPFWVPGSES